MISYMIYKYDTCVGFCFDPIVKEKGLKLNIDLYFQFFKINISHPEL